MLRAKVSEAALWQLSRGRWYGLVTYLPYNLTTIASIVFGTPGPYVARLDDVGESSWRFPQLVFPSFPPLVQLHRGA